MIDIINFLLNKVDFKLKRKVADSTNSDRVKRRSENSIYDHPKNMNKDNKEENKNSKKQLCESNRNVEESKGNKGMDVKERRSNYIDVKK